MMKKYAVLLVSLLSFNGIAYENQNMKFKQGSDDYIEVIEVYGYRPLSVIRKDLANKQLAIATYFNDNIDDDDLKFVCKNRKTLSSNISKRSCRNAFERRIRLEELQNQIRLGSGLDGFNGSAELDQRFIDKREAVEKLLESDESFQDMFISYKKTQLEFRATHKKRFGALSGYNYEDEPLKDRVRRSDYLLWLKK